MVFRFSEDCDKELMRELIAHKSFSAKYGETGQAWERVAAGVSTAVQATISTKQVQDRLRLLRKNWKAGELRAAVGSGIEEALEATNEQSHYDTLAGLVGQYIQLEEEKTALQKTEATRKKAKNASLETSASEIIAESNRRRALRNMDALESFRQ